MLKKYTVTKEVTFDVTIWSCDHDGCDFSISENKGCCGVAPIMTCHYCEKHVCRHHRKFADGSGDSIIAVSCLDEKCVERLSIDEDNYWSENDE